MADEWGVVMSRLLALTLGVAVAAQAAPAADPPPAAKPAESRSLASRLNPFGSADPGKPAPAPSRPAPAVGPLAPDVMIQALQAEQDAYARRLDVCTELRRVAVGTKDDALGNKADELERLAEATYNQRIAKLGVKSQHRNPPGGDKLDAELGGGVAVNPLNTGVRIPADPRPATAQVRQYREVKP